MTIPDRSALLASMSRPIVPLAGKIPGFAGVCMRALTGAETNAIYQALGDRIKESRAFTEAIVTSTLCDETGSRLFEIADAAVVFDAPAGITNELTNQALSVNRMRTEADEPGK